MKETFHFELPSKVWSFWALMADHGHTMRIAGGFVRDTVMGVTPKDVDFCTTALPEQVVEVAEKAGFRVEPTGLQHGTVSVIIDGVAYEVTTLRVDTDCDGRHAEVEFTTDFEADAARRDFTFNAMTMDPDGTVHDYFGGIEDARERRIRFVGNAEDRIREDYLRVLRFLRFAARFGCDMDVATVSTFCEPWVRVGLANVSVERVWAEVSKMFEAKDRAAAVMVFVQSGLAETVGLAPNRAFMKALVGKPDACLMLAGMCGFSPAATCRALKTSVAEERKVSFLFDVMFGEKVTERRFAQMVLEGVNPKHLRVAASVVDPAFESWVDHTWPKFPVNGNQLLDEGFSGPQLGQELARRRAAWVETVLDEAGL